jgi:hypothetical protein
MRKKLFPKHSDHPAPEVSPDLEIIFSELSSPEDRVRADAVRKLCPCRGTALDVPVQQKVWDLRNDPSPLVRQAVEHDLRENPDWNKRTEARRIANRLARQEEADARREIEAAITGNTETPLRAGPHSLGWRMRPRRRTHGRHRLSR